MCKQHCAVLGILLGAALVSWPMQAALPSVTVAATDATAIIGTSDSAVLTFSRSGSTASGLTVDFSLGGSAAKWTDYRRLPEGDMPVAVTIPAGQASVTMPIFGMANSTLANPETVLVTLSSSSAY